MPWGLLLRFWKPLAGAIVLVGILWAVHHHGYNAGKATVQAAWDKDKSARAAASAKATADAAATDAANRARNEVIEREYQSKLAAIAADRDSLAGRLREYESRLRSFAAAKATDQRGLDVAAGIAARQRAIDEAYDAYDRACRNDAVRFSALQQEVAGQL